MEHGWGCAAPIFRVASLREGLDYYVNVLGFSVDWNQPDLIASVSREGCCLFLSQGDQGNPRRVDVDRRAGRGLAARRGRARGATIRHPPTNYP